MPPGDDRDGGVIPGSGFDFDVEFFLDSLLQSDGDAFLVHIPLAACHGLGIDVAQHFEPVGGLADQGAERNGDRQADHARAGDAHAMAFLRILAERRATMRSGSVPRISVAFATQRATAMGSVQPMAGTTSRLIRATICSRSG